MTKSPSPLSHYFKFSMGWQWLKAIIIQWLLNRLREINWRPQIISLGREVCVPADSNCHPSSKLSTRTVLGKVLATEQPFRPQPCAEHGRAAGRELTLRALAEAHSLGKQKALFQTITSNILQGLLSVASSDKLMLYLIVLLIQINEITYGNRYSYSEYNEEWGSL